MHYNPIILHSQTDKTVQNFKKVGKNYSYAEQLMDLELQKVIPLCKILIKSIFNQCKSILNNQYNYIININLSYVIPSCIINICLIFNQCKSIP